MSHKNHWTRRDLLAGGALLGASTLALPPVEKLLQWISQGLIAKAQAEAEGLEGSRNYINVLMAGGPCRYVFDAWLRTRASDPSVIFNPMVTTKFQNSGGRVSGLEYATFDYNGTLVPHLFSHSVFNGRGELRPLSDYLNHMLVIRGFGTGFDGHPTNAAIQQAPLGGVSSIAGLAADHSVKTFEAIEWPPRGAYGNYFSTAGRALNVLQGGNPLFSLLEGFGPPPPALSQAMGLKERNQEAYNLAQARLIAYSQSDQLGASIVGKNLSNARDLMKKGIGNLEAYWAGAVARYRNLIDKSARLEGLAGLTDVPVVSMGGPQWQVFVVDGKGLRTVPLEADFDLLGSLKSMVTVNALAEGLALAEYVLREGLATSINIMASDISNVLLKDATDGSTNAGHVVADMHSTGAYPALLLFSAQYRGLLAGVLELSDQLRQVKVGGTDLWSETVIQFTSEFNRAARSDGSGSDHGVSQMVTSVFSGAIAKGPYVVGNIYRGGLNPGYDGTQGIGAPIDGYNQKGMPNPVMAASTVAALLRVPKNPFENVAAPLIKVKSTELEVIKKAEIIES